MHNLQKIREILEVSQQWLAAESDVSLRLIKEIESEDKFSKTNNTIAAALADALGVQVLEIFHPSELSRLGRPAHTARPISHHTAPSYVVHSCNYMTYTGGGVCTNCEQPLIISANALDVTT